MVRRHNRKKPSYVLAGISDKNFDFLNNLSAEKTILQCLLHDSSIIGFVCENLKPEAFYFTNHGEIFKIIIAMYNENLLVNIDTLANYIKKNKFEKTIGGLETLVELYSTPPNLFNVERSVKIINDKFIRRSLIKLAYEINLSALTPNSIVTELLSSIEFKVVNLTTNPNLDKVENTTEILKKIIIDLREKSLNPGFMGISSGYRKLDSLTQGFQKSDLIILAGRPSMGKTALSLNFALNVIHRSELPVLIFSLEMSQEQIMYRIIASESDIPLNNLRSGRLSKAEWGKITKIVKNIASLPLFVNDTSNLTIQMIYQTIRNIKSKHNGLGLVIIDYLQLIEVSNATNHKEINRAQELAGTTKSLKNLAREFDVPVLALSQLSRNVETRIGQKPILSDLRESGAIEQDADLVLMLSNQKTPVDIAPNAKNIDLIVAKHRNGPLGTVSLQFHQNLMKFIERLAYRS